jgi:hypothetical protein
MTASLTLPLSACVAILHRPARPSISVGVVKDMILKFSSLSLLEGVVVVVVPGSFGPIKFAPPVMAELPVSPCVYVPVVSIYVVLAKSKFCFLAPSFELIEVTLFPFFKIPFLGVSVVSDYAILSSRIFRRPASLLISKKNPWMQTNPSWSRFVKSERPPAMFSL